MSAICLLVACTSAHIRHYTFNQKTAAPLLRRDMLLLQQILEEKHPGLYWYTSKDSIDLLFQQATNSINDSLTEKQFRNKLAAVVSKIRCGHTAVRFSKNYTAALDKYKYPQFPLYIKTWGDSLVVVASALPKDTIFKRGTIITSINKIPNKLLLDSMMQLIGTDGYSNNYKSQVFSGNFPYWYQLAWGTDSCYTIEYIHKNGQQQSVVIRNYTPAKDTSAKRINKQSTTTVFVKQPSNKQLRLAALLNKRSLRIDTPNSTAFMRVTTFSNTKLRSFFRKSFATIQQQHIQNLVIDIRENGGGYLNNSNLLTRYLIDKPFKTADTVAAKSHSLHYWRYIPALVTYWWPLQLAKKMPDGGLHFLKNEGKYKQPLVKNHFNNNIYVLQGGYTFSAASLFAGTLKGQKNVTIVGEETGGGFYGNNAFYLPTIVLPNSKLRVVLPLCRMVVDSTRQKNGRGVLPDVVVQPTSNAIKSGIDAKLLTVKELIVHKNAQNLPKK